MSRPIHYAAWGRRSLAFECYLEELAAWENSMEPRGGPVQPGWPRPLRPTKPAPKRSTDLQRVTCPDCWREIKRMANDALSRAGRYTE